MNNNTPKPAAQQATPSAPPKQMLAVKRWLLWKLEPPLKAGGKPRKVPYYTSGAKRSGTLDSPGDVARLVSYAAARKAMIVGAYTGLGFALGAGFHGLDLDGCRNTKTGVFEPWADAFIAQASAAQCYVELSPSGMGAHCIGYGAALDTVTGNGVELYSGGRYFTMTGQRLNGQLKKLGSVEGFYDAIKARSGRATKAVDERKPLPGGRGSLMWPETRLRLPALFSRYDVNDRPQWVKMGQVAHKESGGSEAGYQLWLEWSKPGVKHDPADQRRVWVSFKRDKGGVGIGTLIKEVGEMDAGVRVERAPMVVDVASDLMGKTFTPVERIMAGRLELTPGVTVLAGKPKHGKSWLAMGIAIAAATGERYMDSERSTPMQAVYVSCDDPSRARFARRLHAFKPKGELTGLLLITDIDPKAGSSLDLLGGLLDKHPAIRLVVIDTLAAFRQGQRNDSPYQQEHDEVKAINDWAHAHNIAVLLVHHLRKGEVDVTNAYESISGTLGLQGACDGMMVLARKDLASDFDAALDEKLAGLWYRHRDLDEEIDMGVRLADGRWSIMGTSSDVFHAGTQREILRVLDSDASRWWSSKEIHAGGDFDCRAASVQRAASRMAKRGLLLSHRGALEGKSGGGGGFKAKTGGAALPAFDAVLAKVTNTLVFAGAETILASVLDDFIKSAGVPPDQVGDYAARVVKHLQLRKKGNSYIIFKTTIGE